MARIREQLESAYRGPAWHGPALREVLRDVSAQHSVAHPVAGAHSIGELVRHAAAWKSIVRRRLAGEALSEVSREQDWPVASEPGWRLALDELDREHEALLDSIVELDEAALTRRVGDTTAHACLTGTAHHDLYHAGQVALLKRAMG